MVILSDDERPKVSGSYVFIASTCIVLYKVVFLNEREDQDQSYKAEEWRNSCYESCGA